MANFVERENIFLRIVKYLIPWKGDKPTEILRKIIFLVSAVVLIVSLVILVSDFSENKEVEQNNDIISDIYHNGVTPELLTGNTTLNIDITPERQEQLKEENPEVLDEFLPLLEINEDVVGWLYIDGDYEPTVDNVIVQGDDNEFYLDHDLSGNSKLGGTVFADYRAPITATEEPANIILYGHNMANGSFFGKVPRYFNYKPGNSYGLDWYRKYPTMTFSTLYEERTYKIFAGMLVNTEKSEGDVFYYLRGRYFDTEEKFNEYIVNILDRSTFYTDVDVQYGDQLLTLSTCILDYQGWDLRFVLFGRRVREGEDPTVDVSKAYENPDPLYFDAYYRVYGGEWGGRKWDEELLYGYTY
ncbi:MAG: class B sortase [Oscillospiraceae bacterium]|nr:class B sortase [Oscillospiraceae bacterium]